MKEKNISILRHSAAHLVAHAVIELFPDTLLTIGPATKDGFFYDFLPQKNFKEEDLAIIEARMHELVYQNIPLTHEQVSKEYARELYKNNPFKLELINDIPDDTVGIARQGDFYDLCRGGHVETTGEIKYFKLLHLSGSYWRANKENQSLQRITGTAFFSQKEMDDFLQAREDALKYDHRRLGKELDLFSFHEEGVGFPFFHPHGKVVLNILTDRIRNRLIRAGYKEIATPAMLSDQLWRRSGHYDHYKENMYFSEIDNESYAIKPMNCPGAILIYQDRPRSYRELPLALAEFGLVHRHELSGVLSGLFRVRSFTQDDAHIFCTEDQIQQEVEKFIQLFDEVMKPFGFTSISIRVSTRPEKAMGSDQLWKKAIQALEDSLMRLGKEYTIYPGEGAFYGPKIEFHIEDSLKRTWQCGTMQIDFFQAENFDLTYVAPDGKYMRPVVLHRAIYGSFERFLAILLEHYKGKFPFWLAPIQVRILPITDEVREYANQIMDFLLSAGIRVECDMSSDALSGQIKRAQINRIPWMIIVGKKEAENNTITIRDLDGKQTYGVPIEQLIEMACKANDVE